MAFMSPSSLWLLSARHCWLPNFCWRHCFNFLSLFELTNNQFLIICGFIAQLVSVTSASRGHGFKPSWSSGSFRFLYAVAKIAVITSRIIALVDFISVVEYNRPSGIYILIGFSEETSTGLPFSVGSLFFLFQTQIGQVKLKISPGNEEAKFSLDKDKKSPESGFTESVTNGCNTWFISYISFQISDSCQQGAFLELWVWNCTACRCEF